MAWDIPPELKMDEEDFKHEASEIIKENYTFDVEVVIDSVKKISPKDKNEIKIVQSDKKAYEILAVISNRLTGEIDRKGFILKKGEFEFQRNIGKMVNNSVERSENYNFAGGAKKPIGLLPRYLGKKGGLKTKFENAGFAFWEAIDSMSVVDKISSMKDVRFLDIVGAFDPYILLHDKLSFYNNKQFQEILAKNNLKKSEEGRAEYFKSRFMKGIENFYEQIPEAEKNIIYRSVSQWVDKYFMPPEMNPIIHDSPPWHNKVISLINPENFKIGPRVIDIGSVIGWPEIFEKFDSKEYMVSNLIKDGYLWKRDMLFRQFNLKGENLDLKLLDEGVYVGSLYKIFDSTNEYALDRMKVKETIDIQLEIMCNKNMLPVFDVKNKFAKYKPRIFAEWKSAEDKK
ncbi:MAG: hypothetical protein KKE23_01145 [Nanoarchaeota archaeon]|nr:hypothetical protein [Nanoarchaeota archaeon]